jgi:hypothetical protein
MSQRKCRLAFFDHIEICEPNFLSIFAPATSAAEPKPQEPHHYGRADAGTVNNLMVDLKK